MKIKILDENPEKVRKDYISATKEYNDAIKQLKESFWSDFLIGGLLVSGIFIVFEALLINYEIQWPYNCWGGLGICLIAILIIFVRWRLIKKKKDNLGRIEQNLNRRKAKLEYYRGNLDKALEYFERVLDIDPNDEEALNGKAAVLGDQEKYEEAFELLDKVLEINPNFSYAWNTKGAIYLELKNYEEAIKCFNKAIEFNPNFLEAWSNRGLAYSDLERYIEAIKNFEKALEIDPKDVESWDGMGIALMCHGDFEKAEKCFNKAIEINPKSSYTLYNFACLKSQQNEEDLALDYLEKAIELNEKWRKQAKFDSDFNNIKDSERFRVLIQ